MGVRLRKREDGGAAGLTRGDRKRATILTNDKSKENE